MKILSYFRVMCQIKLIPLQNTNQVGETVFALESPRGLGEYFFRPGEVSQCVIRICDYLLR